MERNRRIAAGAVALAIAAGGSIAAYSALREPEPTGIAVGGTGGTGANTPAGAALVMCDGTRTLVETPAVRPQPDGVHVLVTNTSKTDLSFQWQSGGTNAPVGRSELVLDVPPGPIEVRCQAPGEDAGAPGGFAGFDVVDPDAVYVPYVLACGHVSAWYADFAPDATGDPDPVQSVRDGFPGFRPGDEVGLAGYPEAQSPKVRVVRDGEVIAYVSFLDDGKGGWLQEHGETCQGVSDQG